jgi:NAD(P)-dependent dehydrogenase (short-subunit alcohol dehydrogenase family)
LTKFLVYVASAAVHDRTIAKSLPSYALTKKAGQILIQTLADEADPKKLQIVSFHPGAILSETAKNAGMTENSIPFDDGKSFNIARLFGSDFRGPSFADEE